VRAECKVEVRGKVKERASDSSRGKRGVRERGEKEGVRRVKGQGEIKEGKCSEVRAEIESR